MKNRYIKLLCKPNIVGMDCLVENLENGGFFISPCSTKYHLCRKGGLLEHSLNVYDMLVKLNNATNAGLSDEDMIVVALLHDIGKMGDHGKPNYVDNVLKTGISKAQPYKSNPDLIYEEHEIRSVIIASRCIKLTEEQEHAILHHNAMWGRLDNSFSCSFDNTKLSLLLHMADLWCSRFVEVEDEKGGV